jgi:hypothetical protein
LDLPTHFVFGFAVGLVFFDKPEIALLIALGTLIPDLDREYWFIPKKVYADEQIHRAGLHNVFIMALAYVVSPFLSLGVFLHTLQDSFTTVKDRGVEWFYPFTRLVKRGLYDDKGNPRPLDPKEKIYFFQEDPRGLVDKADPDLREYGCEPIPWRRVYGFGQNSQILDKSFLVGSVIVILIWFFAPGNALHVSLFTGTPIMNYFLVGFGFLPVLVLFGAGELDRRGHAPLLGRLSFLKYPIFGAGIVLLIVWLILLGNSITENIATIFYNPAAIIIAGIIIPLAIFGIVKIKTRNGKKAVV